MRQDIVHDNDDRTGPLADPERSVLRCDWELLAFVVRSNHVRLVLKTPGPISPKGCKIKLTVGSIAAGAALSKYRKSALRGSRRTLLPRSSRKSKTAKLRKRPAAKVRARSRFKKSTWAPMT